MEIVDVITRLDNGQLQVVVRFVSEKIMVQNAYSLLIMAEKNQRQQGKSSGHGPGIFISKL